MNISKKTKKVKPLPPKGLCDKRYCKKKCGEFFSIEEQNSTNEQFYKMNYQQRDDFLIQNTMRFKSNNLNNEYIEHNYKYFLKNREVCQKLFLNTIGVKCASKIVRLYAKCDKLELNSNTLISAPLDQRSNNRVEKRKHSLEFNNSLKNFINSKNPQKSHYDPSVKKLYIDNYSSLKLYQEFAKSENFEPRFEYKKIKPLTAINTNLKSEDNGQEVCSFSHFKKVCKK
jgi:hypothetical protein